MAEATDMNLRNFRLWIRDPVCRLLKQKDAGFALAMISFPVLERLLRGKSGVSDNPLRGDYSEPFYTALTNCFPSLQDPPSGTFRHVAQLFWQGFRNGILHQATFSKNPIMKGKERAAFCVFEPGAGIAIEVRDLKRVIVVDPFPFSESVLELIEEDFDSYEKADYDHHDLAFQVGSRIVSI
ncbi:MAG: hypothetical protein WCF18_11395 [Chthoniobacteraceae bacterium]